MSESNTPAKSLTALLPLLKESITSTATVAHTFKIIHSIFLKVNPSQIPVITADQPVYAIAMQVQWLYLNSYGEDKVFVMMGALHIEMCLLSAIGDWLEGSGWVEILVRADIKSPGRAESMLQGRQVKRCRYVHQITCAGLYILLLKGYEMANSLSSLQQWTNMMRSKSQQFNYWFTVIELMSILLQLVRSLREANFAMFLQALEER